MLSIGLMATICEMAWNQGIDLYGCDDDRFLKGAEYAAKWNLGQDVPYTSYTWKYGYPGLWGGEETLTAPSPDGRGQARPIWESIYNHYVNRRAIAAPHVTAIAARVRPEGGGGDYGPNSGGFDHLGFGTFAFTGPGHGQQRQRDPHCFAIHGPFIRPCHTTGGPVVCGDRRRGATRQSRRRPGQHRRGRHQRHRGHRCTGHRRRPPRFAPPPCRCSMGLTLARGSTQWGRWG
ncbi:hypothetical protein [Streptomyces sp. NBC_00453]|uniref:hypothetical protein n=1 Tax=Streptomyces sp. NBC_00453 TaxID=2903653 RepID=UPI003FA7545A